MSVYGGVDDKAIGASSLVVSFAACHQGQPKFGVEHSWMSLIASDAVNAATFVDFRDSRKFDEPIHGNDLMARNIGRALAISAREHRPVPAISLCFGGDHTISIGTVIATRKVHPKTRLVWIDAHPDINTPFTSLSGNCHGMPVAYLLNWVDNFKCEHPLDCHEVAYIGVRSMDEAESARLDYLKDRGGLIFSSADVHQRGIEDILNEIGAKWSGTTESNTEFEFPVHVSLDIDCIDPEYAPATGTPVPGGMLPSDVQKSLKFFNERSLEGISHLDIVEVNPYLSTAQGAAKTVHTTDRVLEAWIRSHRVIHRRVAMENQPRPETIRPPAFATPKPQQAQVLSRGLSSTTGQRRGLCTLASMGYRVPNKKVSGLLATAVCAFKHIVG